MYSIVEALIDLLTSVCGSQMCCVLFHCTVPGAHCVLLGVLPQAAAGLVYCLILYYLEPYCLKLHCLGLYRPSCTAVCCCVIVACACPRLWARTRVPASPFVCVQHSVPRLRSVLSATTLARAPGPFCGRQINPWRVVPHVHVVGPGSPGGGGGGSGGGGLLWQGLGRRRLSQNNRQGTAEPWPQVYPSASRLLFCFGVHLKR
jgi:hypothetical protein